MKNMLPEYVDELAPYDVDMLEHSLNKNAKDYTVKNIREARSLAVGLIDKAIKRAGVFITPNDTEISVKRTLKKQVVKIENRKGYSGDDAWRNGTYVYKGMELIGFISEPLYKRASILAINQSAEVVVRAAIQ